MNRIARFTGLIIIAWLLGGTGAKGNVNLPAIFGDHMVLQQDLGAPVWGTADPGEAVKVTLGGASVSTVTGTDGRWMVKLPAMGTGTSGESLTVAGKNTVTYQDVLIGEVWLCSGQSNMAFRLDQAHNAATELPAANDGEVRMFLVGRKASHLPQPDVSGTWKVCTPASAGEFSAVGYFFAKELRAKYGRPVGLIGSYFGGTPAQAWTSLEGLKKEAALGHYVEQWNQIDSAMSAAVLAYPGAKAKFDAEIAVWRAKYAKDLDAAVKKWRLEEATHGGNLPYPQPPEPAPIAPPPPEGGQNAPASLYNGMIAPLEPYGIRGVIWYQGESNEALPDEYHTLFARMIEDWREAWGEGDFPFLFVQLAGYYNGKTDAWARLREGQFETLSLPKTGMATAIDIGLPDNIHPMDKLDVGHRLALVARDVAYGETVVDSGPVFSGDPVVGISRSGTTIALKYKDSGSGLCIGAPPWVGPNAVVPPGDRLTGFEVAGKDGKWRPAQAEITGSAEVTVSCPDVPVPSEVRYNWKGYPDGNLYNKEGLPALPFKAALGGR
jgi:sialate O-acetylesterase